MDASKMSIKELKQVFVDARVPVPTGIEKPELIKLAQQILLSRPMKTDFYPRVRTFGADIKDCKAIFVFFHGYGADEEQFLFLENMIDPRVTVVCPKAPADGWWPLDVMEWAMALQSGALLQKIKECPRGLPEARANALKFIESLRAKAPAEAKILLGGFSQGGVMATDVALSMDPTNQIYLACFSAFLCDTPYWETRANVHGSNLTALVTHGKTDPLIPFLSSEMISSLLTNANCKVKLESHPGGHTLGDERILGRCKEFFASVLSGA